MGQQEGWELIHIATTSFVPRLAQFPPLLAHARINPTGDETRLLYLELLSHWPRGQGKEATHLVWL